MHQNTERAQARAEQRREVIVSAARRVLAQSGFAGASITAVAAEAGCSTGLIYTYFAGRDQLLSAAFAAASQKELRQIERVAMEAGELGECLDAIVRTFIERAVVGRRLAYALLFEAVPEPVQEERLGLRLGYAQVFASMLERFLPRGGGAPHPESTADGAGAETAVSAEGAVGAEGIVSAEGAVRAEGIVKVAGIEGAAGATGPASDASAISTATLARSLAGVISENLYFLLSDDTPLTEAQVEKLWTEIATFARRAIGVPAERRAESRLEPAGTSS